MSSEGSKVATILLIGFVCFLNWSLLINMAVNHFATPRTQRSLNSEMLLRLCSMFFLFTEFL